MSQKSKNLNKEVSAESETVLLSFSRINDAKYFCINENNSWAIIEGIISFKNVLWKDLQKKSHTHNYQSKKSFTREGLKEYERYFSRDSNHKISNLWQIKLKGLERLIGLRRGRVFEIIWYDSVHKFCTSK